MNIFNLKGLGKYKTGYEIKIRMISFFILQIFPVILIWICGLPVVFKHDPLSAEVSLRLLIFCICLNIFLVLFSIIFQLFTRVILFIALKTSHNTKAGTIDHYEIKEHRGGRGGVLWKEMIPFIRIDDRIVRGSSFQDSCPPEGTECSVVIFLKKYLIFEIEQ